MADNKFSLPGAMDTMINKSYIDRSDSLTNKNKRKIVMQLLNKLPSVIMGNKNTGTAYDKIKGLVDNNNYSGAKDYVKSQLDKIIEQTAGTMSAAWAKE